VKKSAQVRAPGGAFSPLAAEAFRRGRLLTRRAGRPRADGDTLRPLWTLDQIANKLRACGFRGVQAEDVRRLLVEGWPRVAEARGDCAPASSPEPGRNSRP